MDGTWLIIILTVITPLSFLLPWKLKFTFYSPTYAFIAVYFMTAVAGYFYYHNESNFIGGFYDIGINPSELGAGLIGILYSLCAFLVGALTYLSLHHRKLPPPHYRHSKNLPMQELAIPFLAIAPLFLLTLGTGLENLLYRQEYLVEENRTLKLLGLVLSPLGILLSGYSFGSGKGVLKKTAWTVVAIMYQAVFFSTATRFFSLSPIFFGVGCVLSVKAGKFGATIILIAIIILPLSIQVPLTLRSLPEQGLLPFTTDMLRGHLRELVVDYSDGLDRLTRNVTFSVPLTSYVYSAKNLSTAATLTSLSPLPSFATPDFLPQWGDFQSQLRVNRHIPYNMIGEALNRGWVFAGLLYFFIGAFFSYADQRNRSRMRRGDFFLPLIITALLMLFIVTSLQYNMRSSMRLIYYAAFFDIAYRVLVTARIFGLRAKSIHPHPR